MLHPPQTVIAAKPQLLMAAAMTGEMQVVAAGVYTAAEAVQLLLLLLLMLLHLLLHT
jgi:hypothetical protein